jgi:hypothetical protein
MKLASLLAEKKPQIVAHWLKLLFESYPPQTAIFLKKEKDKFDNPIGYRLSRGVEALFTALLAEGETGEITAGLDEILSIRALQGSSPSRALAFVFLLKNVVREELAKELKGRDLAPELAELDASIDGMALLAFDVYTQRREKLTEIRINEVKNQVSALMRKSGLSVGNL